MSRTASPNRTARRTAWILTLSLGLSIVPVALGGTAASAASAAAARPAASVTGLTVGSRGDAVTTLQRRLIEVGIDVYGGADGVFGPATEAAVRQFQTSKGLAATGSVDEATAAALGLTAPAPNPLVGLTVGSSGSAVRTLQQRLVNAGIQVAGGVDGIFGPGTAAAVKAFQNAKGLPASGRVDAATAQALGAGGGAPAPAPAPSGNPLVGLRIGATGNAVKQLQQTLINAGIRVVGGADGVFGVATANALSQFQYAKGIKVTARVDEATAAALGTPAAVPSAPAAPAAPQAPAAPTVGLAPGSVGEAVKALQQALLDAGVRVPGGADGLFGPATANALKTFQTSQGLPATGKVDAATAAALASPKPAQPAAPAGGGFAAYGERGDRVRRLQQALLDAGIAVRGGADGIFGSATAGAVIAFQRQRGLTVSGVVDQPTAKALGLTAQGAPAPAPVVDVKLQAFPMQGPCFFGDTWHAPRGGGRLHEGVDLGGAEGLYIYAVADGTITKRYSQENGTLTGNGLRLTTADGTYFFYAHLKDVAPGIDVGTKVRAGQIIGTNGKTGNAGVPHLHFEVHPKGGAAVNPYPLIKAIDGCRTTTPPPQP